MLTIAHICVIIYTTFKKKEVKNMKKTNEKPSFIEKEEITNEAYAHELLEKEGKKFKFKLICTCISILTTIMWIVGTGVGKIPEAIEYIIVGILGIGILATIISSPIEILKIIGKFIKYGFYVGVANPIFILLTVPLAALLAIFLLIYAPVVYCGVSLYNSYQKKKSAEMFLGLADVSK